MSVKLALIDVSPAQNPDTLTFLATFAGNSGVAGIGDLINLAPYSAGNNPNGFTNPNSIPLPEMPNLYTQSPTVEAENIGGYYVQPSPLALPATIQGVAQGIQPVNGFALRMYAPGGGEVATATAYAGLAGVTGAGAGVQIAITLPHNQ